MSYSDELKGNTIFDTEYFYRKEIVRNYRDEIIDSLIVTSNEFYKNTIEFNSEIWSEENINDYKSYIVDKVCMFLKESNSINDIRNGFFTFLTK
jgi:hypothetical protein